MNFCLHPENFRGGNYNPNVFKPGRNGNLRSGLIRSASQFIGQAFGSGGTIENNPAFQRRENSELHKFHRNG
jgi:hypothetical protein